MFDLHNPWMHSFLLVQIVGFPLAFLVRAAVRLARMFMADPVKRRKNAREALANCCFAATSITFAYSEPIGVVCLIVGIGLSILALMDARLLQPANEQMAKSFQRRPISEGNLGSRQRA